MRGHACQYTTNGSPLLQIAQHRDLQLSDHSSIAVYSKQFMRRELVGSNRLNNAAWGAACNAPNMLTNSDVHR